MTKADRYDSYIALAVEAFKAQDRRSLKALKDFLTALPSPVEIELVLAAAVWRTAELAPESCRWLLRHPNYLLPELDVVEMTVRAIFSRLQSHDLVQGQDFWLENTQLKLSETAKVQLLQSCSLGDRLLLKEVLQVDD